MREESRIVKAQGDAGAGAPGSSSRLDADTERVVTLLNGLTGLAESGLREKVAAMPADERARLGALASEILDDAPPAHPRRERMSDRELDNAIIAALGVQRAEYRAGHSAIRSVVA